MYVVRSGQFTHATRLNLGETHLAIIRGKMGNCPNPYWKYWSIRILVTRFTVDAEAPAAQITVSEGEQ